VFFFRYCRDRQAIVLSEGNENECGLLARLLIKCVISLHQEARLGAGGAVYRSAMAALISLKTPYHDNTTCCLPCSSDVFKSHSENLVYLCLRADQQSSCIQFTDASVEINTDLSINQCMKTQATLPRRLL
jgi:hypothetical protein